MTRLNLFYRKKTILTSGSLSRLAFRKFMKNRLSVVSVWFIVLTVVIAILGYLITPDSTPFANQQYLELATKKPGFRVSMLKVRKQELPQPHNLLRHMIRGGKKDYYEIPISAYRIVGRFIYVSPYEEETVSGILEKKYDLVSALYPLQEGSAVQELPGGRVSFTDIEGHWHQVSVEQMEKEVTEKNIVIRHFPLGTDRFGRDVLSMLLIGTRVSLSVGFISVFISLVLGILMGALAGFFRGWVDNLVVWFINVIWSIPTLLLVIAITFSLGKGFWQVFVAVGLTMWVEVARVVRGQILSIREKEFVEAAKALGYNNFRIIWRHILPNVMGPVIVISAANFASAILLEAGLSFLGIGVQPPMPSWGSMIRDNYAYIILDKAWLAVLPGLAIMLMVLAFMLVGNGLRDALDVREKSYS